MLPRTKRILQFSAVCLTILLLAYSMIFTQIYYVESTDLGLVSRMPTTFWVGLVFLSFVWFVCRESKHGLIVALALTIGYLFVAPAIIRVPVWLSNSYYPFGESSLINSSGHLVDYPSTTLNSYHYWPLFLYFSSALVQITRIPDSVIMKYFPLFFISLFGLLVYLILRVRMKTVYAIFGTGWFVSSFWLRQQYFGPPAFGYVFFLLGLLILSHLFFTETAKKRTLAALFLMSFAIVTITHALSAFMLIAALVALYFAYRFTHKHSSVVAVTLVLFSIAIFLSYNMFSAQAFFNLSSRTFYSILSLSRALGFFKEPSRVTGSTAQVLNYRSTLAVILVNVSIAAISIFLLLRKRFSHEHLAMSRYNVFWIIFLILLVFFAVGAEYGPHEAYQRAFMFGLIPLSYFCINLLSKKPKMLLVILTTLIFLNIPAQYGPDSYTLVRNPELSGSEFFATHTPQKTVCFYGFSLTIRYYNPLKEVKFLTLGTLPFTEVPNASSVNEALNKADYVIVSDKQNNYYYYFLGQNPLDQVDLEKFNRIYDSSSLSTLTHANRTSSS